VIETSVGPLFTEANVATSLIAEESQQVVGSLKDSVAVFTTSYDIAA